MDEVAEEIRGDTLIIWRNHVILNYRPFTMHLPSSIRLLALLLALDILLDSGLPLVFVALVQGVDLSPGGDLHVGVSEDKLPDGGVEHEAVDLLVDGDHHHGGAAVEGVPRGHHLAPRLEG